MRQGNRKSTPKVKDGKVQRKNRSAQTPDYWNTKQPYPVIDKEKPGEGYRHVLKKRDIEKFIDILPDWEELSVGLDAILLARGEWNTAGWHSEEVVAICAWEKSPWRIWDFKFYDEHKHILERLCVPTEKLSDGVRCKFDDDSIRGWQLMHILLHELGHHHDQMTTKSKKQPARGEPYAEQYANRYAKTLWERYFQVFGY